MNLTAEHFMFCLMLCFTLLVLGSEYFVRFWAPHPKNIDKYIETNWREFRGEE